MKRLLSTAIALLLTIPGISHAERITAIGDPWPPFLSPDLLNQGIALEIVRAAFKVKGHEVEMKFAPWARALYYVKQGRVDILVGTWMTKERTEFLNYSDVYLVNNIKFIKRIGDSFEFDGLASLNGKTVGTVRAYGYSNEFIKADNFNKEETNSFIMNLKKLTASPTRLDLILEDEIVARTLIAKKAPDLKNKIAFSTTTLSRNTLHVTSGLKNPKNQKIISDFNNGLAVIKENGVYDSILKKNGLM
jgi:polar amino acid transport system substrate-binding protein